ncbi:unnamed protein product [Paramecium primaurelia]|uniref:Uncharacterized protein n=1 Tax=Paramecium primaurelia TaxID=5886 RepID=A0A8S1PAE4_PARPR|nr:unnamed protein product [Paramecium primaurelia]
MWNYASSSKIIEQKQQAYSYDRHVKVVNKAKATVDNGIIFIQQHYTEINRSNSALLRKMMYINSHSSNLNKQKLVKSYKELSHVFKNNKQLHTERDRVQDENEKIVARLQATKSYYERDSQLIKAQKYIACRNNISQNARRTAYQDFCDESYGLTKISLSKQY